MLKEILEAKETDVEAVKKIWQQIIDLDNKLSKVMSKEDYSFYEGDEDLLNAYGKIRKIVKKYDPDHKWK